MGHSAPEQADWIEERLKRVAPAEVERLALRWLDHAMREILPLSYERAGLATEAAAMRGQPPLSSRAAIADAYARAFSKKLPTENINVLAAHYDAAGSLTQLVEEFSVWRCCFSAVMTSRMVYGDDRIMNLMKADLGIDEGVDG
ncbi:MAG: hypothetical protein JST54_01480 [Deltaproteobacteria bacterium]|nr:hypothetical protein [Deltaproteobacteria bacterium]